jgi:2-phosphosulfolactate phosphatase
VQRTIYVGYYLLIDLFRCFEIVLIMHNNTKPTLYTCLSPALLHLYNVTDTIVVIIDILRATSTIATALYNNAASIIPVDSVAECIQLGKQLEAITAGERDGKVAEGLAHGNSPFEYDEAFIGGKILVLTTTNGTKLLHMALQQGAHDIITGAFVNISAVCNYLIAQQKNVILGCAAWKDKVNMEDTLFAGAVISRIKNNFEINCDASYAATILYENAKHNLLNFMEPASHFKRLSGFGLHKDLGYCFTEDQANILPIYKEGRLIKQLL